MPGSPELAGLATTALNAVLPTSGARMFVLESEFSADWFRFFHAESGAPQMLQIDIGVEQLPFAMRRLARTRALAITRLDLIVESDHPGSFDVQVASPGQDLSPNAAMSSDPTFGGLHHFARTFPAATALLGQWRMQIKRDTDAAFDALPQDAIRHAYLLVQFAAA